MAAKEKRKRPNVFHFVVRGRSLFGFLGALEGGEASVYNN